MFTQRVKSVTDGDTFEVYGWEDPIRLKDVWAPETDQPGGLSATNYLNDLIGGKLVDIYLTGEVSFERVVADVYVDGKCVNTLMRTFLNNPFSPPPIDFSKIFGR